MVLNFCCVRALVRVTIVIKVGPTRLDSPLRETIVASFIDSRYLFSTPFDDSVRLSQTRTFALLMINNTLSPIRGVGGGRDLESYYFYASYQLGYYIAPLPPDPTTTTADEDGDFKGHFF